MAVVEVEDGLTVRFPGRNTSFREGVEIGLLLADLAAGLPEIERRVGAGALDQARQLAGAFGYRLAAGEEADGTVPVVCAKGRERPRLTVIPGGAAG